MRDKKRLPEFFGSHPYVQDKESEGQKVHDGQDHLKKINKVFDQIKRIEIVYDPVKKGETRGVGEKLM
jgi:hypothetical protein